ncbi:MAG TPA: hypothetical protein VJT72_03630 [Pseudonocardiaceae bacterium]|nr:hypothetical protein [Pseudonocardiaceae bacterium]
MIREDRELLAELAHVNTDVLPLAMRIMEGNATAEEQHEFAERLILLGQRLHHRADGAQRMVLDGTVLLDHPASDHSHDDTDTGNHQNS